MEQYGEFEEQVRQLYRAVVTSDKEEERKALVYFERYNRGELAAGLDYFFISSFRWLSSHLGCALREIVFSDTDFDGVWTYVDSGFIDDYLLLIGDLINDHVGKYVKKYKNSENNILTLYQIISRYILGSEDQTRQAVEVLDLARDWRLELLKIEIIRFTREYVGNCKERWVKARELANRKKYENTSDNSISNRLEPILRDTIDYISEELSTKTMESKDVIKLLSSVLTPLAKMRGELSDGIEITSNNVFYRLTQAADAIGRSGNVITGEGNFTEQISELQIQDRNKRLLEEME